MAFRWMELSCIRYVRCQVMQWILVIHLNIFRIYIYTQNRYFLNKSFESSYPGHIRFSMNCNKSQKRTKVTNWNIIHSSAEKTRKHTGKYQEKHLCSRRMYFIIKIYNSKHTQLPVFRYRDISDTIIKNLQYDHEWN